MKGTRFRFPALPADVTHRQRRGAGNLTQLGSGAVNELGAELDPDRQLGIAQRENPSSDALARLEHDDTQPRVMQQASGLEAGNAGADHHDVRSR